MLSPYAAQTATPPSYQSTPKESIGHVAEGVSEQERLLMLLHEELSQLESRLIPVCRPMPSTTGNSAATPAPVRSPLGEMFARHVAGLNDVIARVRGLTAALDL